jgi:hypothetical protein
LASPNIHARHWTAVVLLGSFGAAWGAPITFNTALPVHEGGWVLREQFVLSKGADDPDPVRRSMRVSGALSVLGYGITGDIALFGIVPYFDKRLDLNGAGLRVARGDEGIGDLTLIGRYTSYVTDAPGRTFRVAPFLGAKAPTGRDDARDGLGRLPPAVQPGSGSWDFLGGVVATYQSLVFRLTASSAKAGQA